MKDFLKKDDPALEEFRKKYLSDAPSLKTSQPLGQQAVKFDDKEELEKYI